MGEYPFTHGQSPWNSALRAIRLSKMIGDLETTRRMGSRKEGDKETQEFANELKAPKQMTIEKDLDENTQDLVEDLLKTLEKN